MSLNVEWTEGAPEEIKPGMLIRWSNGDVTLVGCDIPEYAAELTTEDATAWAWIIQPYQLQWVADMASFHLIANNRATRKPQ